MPNLLKKNDFLIRAYQVAEKAGRRSIEDAFDNYQFLQEAAQTSSEQLEAMRVEAMSARNQFTESMRDFVEVLSKPQPITLEFHGSGSSTVYQITDGNIHNKVMYQTVSTHKHPTSILLRLMQPNKTSGLLLGFFYDNTWAIAVHIIGDQMHLPEWPMKREWGTHRSYSETLTIEVPEDIEIVQL